MQRRKFLTGLADQGLSLGEGARSVGMTPTGFVAMIKREGVAWEPQYSRKDKQTKPRKKPEQYRECAESGMTVAEASGHLDVSFNAVREMAERHGIKFKDGRKAK